ncbi:MAG: glycine cleavage T C-terminal barrel domain-containing protein [Caulobacteraceae bacterium]
MEPLWRVDGSGKAFVDFQNDVIVCDIALAARENYVSLEHLKRYTTLGMAPDQGKMSNVNALAIMGELTGRSPPEVGTTRYRPPFTPTSLAAFGGRARGALFRPEGRTPMHGWHAVRGARFEDFGDWARPAAYPRADEDHEAAVRRECLAVRDAAGLFDASPLGKIEVVGPDAGAFLDRIYANPMSTLKPGRIRYGLMLNELGVAIDDGVAARLAEDRFLLSTTSAGAERIAAWLEEWLQCEWPELRVIVAPVTADWGAIAVAGPRARAILQSLGGDIDLSAGAFPHMALREGRVGDIAARVARVSFTGEVTFEVNVPADRALELWERLIEAGGPRGAAPVGVDAWARLRAEKGYLLVGVDTDGTTVAADVGWGGAARREADFIGKRSLLWVVNQAPDRLRLVGLAPVGGARTPPVGAPLGRPGGPADEGFITSSGFSPSLGRGVALGMVRGGEGRLGETLAVGGSTERVRIAPLAAYDPQGERLRG